MKAALCAAAILAAGCGKAFHSVNKGPPQHVLMQASESPRRLVFKATRRSPTRIELKLKQQREVSVARTVIYGSSESYSESGSMLWELLELPFGLLLAPFAFLDFKATATPVAGQLDLGGKLAWVLLNPFERMWSTKLRTQVPSDRIAFKDPPRHRAYNVKLPLEGVTISYRILDDAKATIASGTGRTDMFGAITIDGVDEAAVGVEVTHGGTTAVVPIP